MPSLSDVEWIYIVLAVLYLSELLVWVRPGSIALVSSWGSFGSRFATRRLTGNDQGDLVLGGITPFDVTLLVESLPLSISDRGVVAFVAAAPLQRDRREHNGREFEWSQLGLATTDDRDIRIGDVQICRVGSRARAATLAAKLRQLAQLDDISRGEAIEAWRRERYDMAAAVERFNAWQESTLALRIGAALLFLWICPVGLILHYGWLPVPSDQWVTLIYLAILFSLWWLTAIVAWMGHRYLYPERRGDRWKQLAYSLLSPAVPLRLTDQLGRELSAWTHPLAVSAAVDSKTKFRDVAERVIRDATFPRMPDEPNDSSENALAIVRASRDADTQCLASLLDAKQIDIHELLAAPNLEDSTSVSYCPRCLHEFIVTSARCDACGQRDAVPI